MSAIRLVGLVACLLFEVAGACALQEPPASPLDALKRSANATLDDYWASPAISGAWFDAARNGEGVILEVLPDGRVLAIWFTYPAAGEAGEQAWMLAQDGRIEGDRVHFGAVVRPLGGRFGATFDPAQVQLSPWGTLDMQFASCNQMTLSWSGPAAYGSGTRTMTRLTSIAEIECGGARQLTSNGGRAAAGLRSRSGAWYVPERSGEGWIVEELPDGRSIVYWFTFDPAGNQAWTVGTATRNGTRLTIENNLIARGTRFGSGFDPAAVQLLPWGSLDIDFAQCGSATLNYASTAAGYGSGTRAPVRLTTLAGGSCLDAMPTTPPNLAWTERAHTPTRSQSEHAVTTLDGKVYALGGFGEPRGMRRFDPALNAWTELPQLPGGRDHLAAFAIDGGVYYVGGAAQGGGEQNIAAFRYDVAAQTWEARPELAGTYGSQAALLYGQAFIGDIEGKLQQYDPRTRRVRNLPADGSQIGRDHAQVIAYLDEIWVIAGRIPETATVAIYDPASERWRAGPRIARRRGGFAAAVVGNRILIGGGEILDNSPAFTERSTEIYNAGAVLWEEGPDLPVAVHGVGGGAINGRAYIVSGAQVAGAATGGTGRVFELALP